MGIESSCDESACASICLDTGKVLNHVVASQWDVNELYGGVYPAAAARQHRKNLPIVVDQVLNGLNGREVATVAVTTGPGLSLCLDEGLKQAKLTARQLGAPLLAINHLEAHVLVSRMEAQVDFPFIALLVSGGHTQLMRVSGVGEYKLLGATLDDAVGEAFDKVARILQLTQLSEESSGACLQRHASKGKFNSRFQLSPPMSSGKHKGNTQFSYSGIKSQVRRLVESSSLPLTQEDTNDIAWSFQEAALDHIIMRIRDLSSNATQGVTKLVVSGGVACNSVLRKKVIKICSDKDLEVIFPKPEHCIDNGVMIAWAGIEKLRLGHSDSMDVIFNDRWPLCSN